MPNAGVTGAEPKAEQMLGMEDNMEIGTRYVVTKASDDGTFEVGDHIVLCSDGAIECKEAQGWIDSSDATEATVGMEVAIDQEWIERRKQKLRDELAALDA